jgi:molecular chaperone GrpE
MPDTDTKAPRVEDKEPEIKVVDRRWWVHADQEALEGAGAQSGVEPSRFELRKPTYVEDLERQLAEKDRQLQEIIGRYKEATRDFDSVKARLRRDVVKDIERGKGAILAELLDVVDNLDRAIEAARRAPGLKAGSPTPDNGGTVDLTDDGRGTAGLQTGGHRLLEGVLMVRDQFLSKLEGLGVRRMAPLGKAFDPARHEAATLVPVTDTAHDNTVLGVIREGYEFNGEVLRPALVAVGQLQHAR